MERADIHSRPLPDMPSFLLTELMSGYMHGRSPTDLLNSIFGSSSAPQENAFNPSSTPAMKPSGSSNPFMGEFDLAYFCRNNNINSNVVPVAKEQSDGSYQQKSAFMPVNRMASSVAASMLPPAVHIPHHVRSGLDERLSSPYKSVGDQDSVCGNGVVL